MTEARIVVLRPDDLAKSEADSLNRTLHDKGFFFLAASTVREVAKMHGQQPVDLILTSLQNISVDDLCDLVGQRNVVIYIPDGPGSLSYYEQQGITFLDSTSSIETLLALLRKKTQRE